MAKRTSRMGTGYMSSTYKAIHACDLWKSEVKWQGSDREAVFAFAKALGEPYVVGRSNIIDTDNPEVMRKLDMILGPNGATILKVMVIQGGEDEK